MPFYDPAGSQAAGSAADPFNPNFPLSCSRGSGISCFLGAVVVLLPLLLLLPLCSLGPDLWPRKQICHAGFGHILLLHPRLPSIWPVWSLFALNFIYTPS